MPRTELKADSDIPECYSVVLGCGYGERRNAM